MLTRILPLLVLLVLSATANAVEGKRPPNIIHIICDDVGYDDLGSFGAPRIKTPNLDALAKGGVRMTRFYAPHSTCTPTRAAILTGRIAGRMPGIDRVLFPNSKTGLNPAKDVCIASLLKGRGYTSAVVGKWHLGHLPEFLPLKNGFDLYFGIPYPNDHDPIRPSFKYAPPIPLYRGDKIVEQPAKLETLPDRFCEEALKFMTENKDRPFFLHYANIETHTPWFIPERFRGKSADGPFGDAVECFDWQVGQLIATLDKLGLAENTLVFVSSDNGPLVVRYPELEAAYGEYSKVDPARPHVLSGGKYQSRMEGGFRVSAIARWPGTLPAGAVRDEIIAGYDLFSTFAALAGATVPTDRAIDGKDVLPLLRGDAGAKPREAFYSFHGDQLQAVQWKQWKMVLTVKDGGKKLFDLSTDLGEKTDISAEKADIIATMTAMADAAKKNFAENKPLE